MTVVGQRVVVTGAGHGIGRAIATRMAAEGARGGQRSGRRRRPSRRGGDRCSRRPGRRGHGLEAPEEDWAALLEVNVMAHVRAARLLVPRWVERGQGRFVVTASAAGLLTMLGSPTYSVSKHAAVAFAEWLSATYRHRGVVVQAICPQGVRTRMLDQAGPLRDLLSHDTALAPEDVAEAVWQGLQDDRFLILPHPEVQGYYERRATDTDAWLAGMNRLQQRLEGSEAVE